MQDHAKNDRPRSSPPSPVAPESGGGDGGGLHGHAAEDLARADDYLGAVHRVTHAKTHYHRIVAEDQCRAALAAMIESGQFERIEFRRAARASRKEREEAAAQRARMEAGGDNGSDGRSEGGD